MFSVNYKDPRPIYEQIKSCLRRKMTAGELQPGSKLPSVRELAAQLAINPNTIQRAYRELEAEGRILTVAGKGSFVADGFATDPQQVKDLLQKLDETVNKLKALGVCADDLCARMRDGGEAL